MPAPAKKRRQITLHRGWTSKVKSGVLHVISLAHYSLAQARAVTHRHGDSEYERLLQEISLLREELRIKDARLAQLAPHRRYHYPPTERMAILELRAARDWSLEKTAQAFLVTAATVSSWMKRLEEHGPDALVQLSQPVNKFPEFVGYPVRRLQTLCPTMGRRKIAEVLARAGLHLGATTVRRMLDESPPAVTPKPPPPAPTKRTCIVLSRATWRHLGGTFFVSRSGHRNPLVNKPSHN